jgi:trimeric autotransporter adhesin
VKLLLSAFLVFSTLAVPRPGSAVPGDERWSDGFGLPDIDGWVHCAVEFEGALVIGGRFSQAGGTPAQNIARWDGAAWSPLGDGFDGEVLSLAMYGGELVASGRFDHGGAEPLRGIARWNGQEWLALGGGLWRENLGPAIGAFALAPHAGVLYAAGEFNRAGDVEARGIARWNGVEWSALGPGLEGGAGRALLVEDGLLFVGGAFDSAGGAPASSIAAWDGVSWSRLGSGLESFFEYRDVTDLVSHEGRVYAGGTFEFAGGIRTNNVAAWDGTAWHAVGDTAAAGPPGSVSALAWVGNELLVASYYLYSWDGTSWTQPPPYVVGWLHTLEPTTHGLLLGGRFLGYDAVGGIGAVNVGIVHDQGWIDPTVWNDWMHGLGGGFNSAQLSALASWGRDLVAAGQFSYAGSPTGRISVRQITRWDGQAWSTLGEPPYGLVQALATRSDTVYAAGNFYNDWPNVIPVIRYVDGVWSPLGTLAVLGTDLAFYQGVLHVGGGSIFADAASTSGLYRWNGLEWESIGSIPGSYPYALAALEEYGGSLIAAGDFDSIGGVEVNGIGAWDGAAWRSMTQGLRFARIHALGKCEGFLYAAGEFQDESNQFGLLARWEQGRWRVIPRDARYPRARIYTLACAEGYLFAGGFVQDQDNVEHGIMRWDGSGWSLLGSGVDNAVHAIAQHEGYLFVGGRFTKAGGRSSSAIARWDLREERVENAVLAARSGVPNPFRSTTSFAYRLTGAGHVRVTIHDLRGRQIAVLEDGARPAGTTFVTWDGSDEDGREAPAGIYFVRMELPGRVEMRRVVRLK